MAQKLMRERTLLENSINGCRRIVSEMSDHAEMIELGEEDGDQALVDEAIAALQKLEKDT